MPIVAKRVPEQKPAPYEVDIDAFESQEAEVENLRVANSWSKASEAERASDRLSWLRGRIAEAWPNGIPTPRRRSVGDLLRDAEDRLDELAPKYRAAVAAQHAENQHRTSEVAKSLQARQRVAVRKIADALELLTAAIKEERLLHDELFNTTPLGRSPFLPGCSPAIGCLDDWRSEAHQWARKMREMGVLK